MNLTSILRSKPLTKSVPIALAEGAGVPAIKVAARRLGYTDAGISAALRAAGIAQRPRRQAGEKSAANSDRGLLVSGSAASSRT